jgi:hypothetical protein
MLLGPATAHAKQNRVITWQLGECFMVLDLEGVEPFLVKLYIYIYILPSNTLHNVSSHALQ